ncbi:hypothetical protein FACS1894189_0990 [Planctomycetales bacterium]|nr:hypothetical protein FACS1894189_0990 [Planctomycetales bacterium]
MPNFYYYDASGQKFGPVNDSQLKGLATQGIIVPQTPMETDTGYKGTAGQIPGLFVASPQQAFQQQPVPQYQSAPYQSVPQASNGKATASLILGCIGLLAWVIPLFGLPITIIGLIMGIKGKSTPGTILCVIGLGLTLINAAIGAYIGAGGRF